MISAEALQTLVVYYEGKTTAILDRYGPGPRVHYHTGLVDEPRPAGLSRQAMRRQLIDAQERMLYHAARVWHADTTLCGEVLDVGCGLGGGTIFWAQEFGARVTAVTCVPSHMDLVMSFAAQAGVQSQVRPLLCDALLVPGENCFDAAVAIDSSGYLPRRAWLQRVSLLLRPGGHLFIADCFLERSEYAEPFNRHWRTIIGTMREYVVEAARAGLRQESIEDLSPRTEHFWTITSGLIKDELSDKTPEACEPSSKASLRAHELVRRGLADGGLRYALMSFAKNG